MKVRLEILLNPPEITYLVGVAMNDDRVVCIGAECGSVEEAVASASAAAAAMPYSPVSDVARRALEILGSFASLPLKPRIWS